MKKNKNEVNINKIRLALRRKLVKNGSRGTTLETLVNTAQEYRPNYNKSHVRNLVRGLGASDISSAMDTKEFFTLVK